MAGQRYSDKAIEILEAAEVRMRRGGFDAVSYRDLAADVGIKGSSVHYHFPQKADLGRAVVERYTENFLAFLGTPDDPEDSVEDRIQRLCLGYRTALQRDKVPCLCCVLGAESLDLPEQVVEAVRHFFMHLIGWTTTALSPLGVAKEAAEIEGLAKHIVSLLQGTMVTALALKQPELLSDAEPYLLRLVSRSGNT